MCSIAIKQPCFEEVSTELQAIWSSLLKEMPLLVYLVENHIKIFIHF